MSERKWSETAVGLEEGVGLSTGRRCSLKRSLSRLFVSPICSSEPTLSLRGIHLMTPVRSSFCSSVPTAPMFLCTYCSSVNMYLLFLCSSVLALCLFL